MPTTPSVRSSLPSALVLLSAACALLTAAVTLAAPAAAIEDPRRPVGEVTHGPSCGPAVVRIAVTNGSQAHRVALVFDGTSEQDVAVLDAGEQGELVSQDVDRGRTVDVSVTVVASDGTAEEPLQFGTYTRPSAEDCAAVTPIQPERSGEPARSEPPTTDTPVPTTTGPEGTTESAPSASTSAPSTSALPPSAADAPLPSGSAPAPDLPRPVPPDATSSSAGEPAGDKTDDPVGDPAADQR